MITVSNLSKIQGGEALYSQGNFQIFSGEKIGLVGPNGAGKSTLFRLIIGEERSDEGQISIASNLRISYFSQNVADMKGNTALNEVVTGDKYINSLQVKLKKFEEDLSDPNLDESKMNKILDQMGEVQTNFEKCGGYDLEVRASEILTGLGIPPEDHVKSVELFSGGQKMRIALAKSLVTNPDLIIMDEPTNYLDMETILWLEEWLKNYKGAIFMTTHDRDFMNNIVGKIIEISNKKITTYSGNYNFYLQERKVRLNQIKAQYNRQQEMLSKEEEFIARFKARASHAAQVQSRVKKLEKIERVELPPEEESISFEFAKCPRGGDDVVVIDNLAKVWTLTSGGEKRVFEGLSTTIRRLEKISVVGVNGAGKSTLLKVISGLTDPTMGNVKIGPSIKLGYFGQQSFESLSPKSTVFDEVRQKLINCSDGYIRNLLAAFLFKGDDVEKRIEHLSGGEKSRLILAVLLAQGNNFLVLDEPTNHLDIKSREVLMEALKKYEGTVLFVSHDRHFLHEVTEKVFEVGQNRVHVYPGDYKYYLSKKK